MNRLQSIFILAIAAFLFSSCEKVIDLDLPDGEKLVYVDAWINDQPGTQTIKLLRAVNYQDPNGPAALGDATITLTDLTDNIKYDFVFANGAYTYTPAGGEAIGKTNHRYRLEITREGETFAAEDLLPRVATIDSLTLEYKPGDGDFEKEGFYAELYVRDLPGAVDHYWIRTNRNGTRNTFLNDMLSIDGSFYADVADGFLFIPPLREGITSGEKPYQKGDVVSVTLRSLTEGSYVFMEQALKQISNGGLFSEVLQNVPANLSSTTPGSTKKIYGWFGTAGETSSSITVN
ncbi:MAG: DUF4249 domain-containing protein [Flavitalea sp.]